MYGPAQEHFPMMALKEVKMLLPKIAHPILTLSQEVKVLPQQETMNGL